MANRRFCSADPKLCWSVRSRYLRNCRDSHQSRLRGFFCLGRPLELANWGILYGLGRVVSLSQDVQRASSSNRDSLDLVQCNLVACSVVELRSAGRLVRSDSLRVLYSTAILQISCDASGAESVATGGRGESCILGALLYHP